MLSLTISANTAKQNTCSPEKGATGRYKSCRAPGMSRGVKIRCNESARSVTNVNHCYCLLSSHDRL